MPRALPTLSNSRRNRARRGQAMLEYSLIFWLIGVAFIMGIGWNGIKTDKNTYASDVDTVGGGNTSMAGMLINAYQIYQDGYYEFLCAPLP